MTALFEACLRVPTVFFTIALGIVLLYWLFVLIGALDIDLFGGDASGAAKGLGEALAGGKGLGDALAGAKGVGDALAGAKGVGDALAGAKGVGDALAGAKGVGDAMAGAKGVGEAVKIETGHHDVDADGGFWNAMGLATVPITISASVVVVVGWALSILGMYYGSMVLGGSSVLLAVLVMAATVVVGIPLSGLLVRPLHPIFKLRSGKSNRDYVGSVCTITTGQVNRDFGQATVEEGGAFLVIAVRCDKPEALKRGDRALIIDFDPARHAYVVEQANNLLS
jgi:hypothetical protein